MDKELKEYLLSTLTINLDMLKKQLAETTVDIQSLKERLAKAEIYHAKNTAVVLTLERYIESIK